MQLQGLLHQQLVLLLELLHRQLVLVLLLLVLALARQLELVLRPGLLFYRKLLMRKLQRWLPKQVICSFLVTLIFRQKF